MPVLAHRFAYESVSRSLRLPAPYCLLRSILCPGPVVFGADTPFIARGWHFVHSHSPMALPFRGALQARYYILV